MSATAEFGSRTTTECARRNIDPPKGEVLMLVESGHRYVAFFDILGFKSWVETAGSHDVFTYVRGFLNLLVKASLPGSEVFPDMTVKMRQGSEANIAAVVFSDSIVFYTRDDSSECLKLLLLVCGNFMNGVICGPSRMIRGALAYGEFYADPESGAYVGKALIDAYQMEGAQEWLALGLHASLAASAHFHDALEELDGYIVPALVPLRGTDIKPLCINWASKKFLGHHSFSAKRGLRSCRDRGRAALAEEQERSKLEHRVIQTYAFLQHYNEEIHGPLDDPEIAPSEV